MTDNDKLIFQRIPGIPIEELTVIQLNTKDFDEEKLFLRIERQVLHGFSNIGVVVFLIRTYVGDIKTLEPDQRLSVATAIEGMTEEEMQYKGMLDYKSRIISILRG